MVREGFVEEGDPGWVWKEGWDVGRQSGKGFYRKERGLDTTQCGWDAEP